jgi:hypothetical protein
MDGTLLQSLFDIQSLEMRVWVLVINSILTIINFGFILAVIVSLLKFKKRVSVQDRSRIAYLEEFKQYVKVLFQRLDNMKIQLETIEKMLHDREIKGK